MQLDQLAEWTRTREAGTAQSAIGQLRRALETGGNWALSHRIEGLVDSPAQVGAARFPAMGIVRVYAPKDFEFDSLMSDIIVLTKTNAAAA